MSTDKVVPSLHIHVSRAVDSAPDSREARELCQGVVPLARQADSRQYNLKDPVKKKRQLSPGQSQAEWKWRTRHRNGKHLGHGILTMFPFEVIVTGM